MITVTFIPSRTIRRDVGIAIRPGVGRIIQHVERECKKECPVAFADLQRGITSLVVMEGVVPVGICKTTSGYGAFVDLGTDPHFPPVEPLERWARRKGMREGAGFAIARKIAREGTPPQPFMRRGLVAGVRAAT